MTKETNHTPVSAPTAGERQSIDTPEFRALLKKYKSTTFSGSGEQNACVALIAHIDTWASRSAGGAVPALEQAVRVCEERALYWHQFDDTYNAGKKAGALDAAEAIRNCGAAPAPGNTEKPDPHAQDDDKVGGAK